METIRGWEKIRKKEKENEKKGHKAVRIRSGRRGGVECGGTIIGLGAITKKWMIGGE